MTDPTATAMLKDIVTALELPIRSADQVCFESADRLASCFLEHRAQNLKQIFAARMLYLKVLDRPDVLHK